MDDDLNISAIVPWFGSKRTMAQAIAIECCRPNRKPPKAFWDLCVGSFAVSLAMPPCSHHFAVDLHEDLSNLVTVMKDPKLGAIFYRRVRRLLAHEATFYAMREAIESDDRKKLAAGGLFADPGPGPEAPALTPLERAIAYFVVSWMGRNGVAGTERINYQPAVRWTAGGGHAATRFRGVVDTIPAFRRRLRTIWMMQRDIFDVLPNIEDEEGTSIYIDPTYLMDGKARSGNCKYKFEMKPEDHPRLFSHVARFRCARVVISYYDDPSLRERFKGWTFIDHSRQKNLHAQNKRGAAKKTAPEILIINGPSYAEGTKP